LVSQPVGGNVYAGFELELAGAERPLKQSEIGKEQFENSQQRLAGSKNLPLARDQISGKLIKLYSQLWRTRENSPKLFKPTLPIFFIFVACDPDFCAVRVGAIARRTLNPSPIFLAFCLFLSRLHGSNSTDNHLLL